MRTHAYIQIQHPYVHTPTQTPIHTYMPRYIPSTYHPSIHARYTDVHTHTLAHALTHTSGRRLAVASRRPPQAHTPAPRRLSDGGAPDGRPARGRRVVVLAAAGAAAVAISLVAAPAGRFSQRPDLLPVPPAPLPPRPSFAAAQQPWPDYILRLRCLSAGPDGSSDRLPSVCRRSFFHHCVLVSIDNPSNHPLCSVQSLLILIHKRSSQLALQPVSLSLSLDSPRPRPPLSANKTFFLPNRTASLPLPRTRARTLVRLPRTKQPAIRPSPCIPPNGLRRLWTRETKQSLVSCPRHTYKTAPPRPRYRGLFFSFLFCSLPRHCTTRSSTWTRGIIGCFPIRGSPHF